MELLIELFGTGKELTVLQMCDRGIVVFIIALVLIRISGRRSFGVRTAIDNIIVVLLGAILSRAVTGASPFMATVATSAVIVFAHRALAYLITKNKFISRMVEGEKIILYDEGQFIHGNMNKALVCMEDVLQGVRKSALTETMTRIDKVYMERNGEISVVKKDKE